MRGGLILQCASPPPKGKEKNIIKKYEGRRRLPKEKGRQREKAGKKRRERTPSPKGRGTDGNPEGGLII